MEEVFVRCEVANGIFTDEREVTIDTREGKESRFSRTRPLCNRLRSEKSL